MSADHAAAQTPDPGGLCLDHVGHFVPDMDAASDVLLKLGFTLTPYSAQVQRGPDGVLAPAGAGNRCIMMQRGYLEILTPTGDTPVGRQIEAALGRYTGVHLVALGTSNAAHDHRRLEREGFTPQAPVDLQRPIAVGDGEGRARFTVVRVPPGVMPEGRVQFCQHLTPELLWQGRWLEHANGAVALRAVVVCVERPEQAAERYARFTGLTPFALGGDRALDTARGRIWLLSPSTIRRCFGMDPPAVPWMAGYQLASARMESALEYITASGLACGTVGGARHFVVAPGALGGIILFEPVQGGCRDWPVEQVRS